jgi:hypothetical protein
MSGIGMNGRKTSKQKWYRKKEKKGETNQDRPKTRQPPKKGAKHQSK